jgi:hypothetical protein
MAAGAVSGRSSRPLKVAVKVANATHGLNSALLSDLGMLGWLDPLLT